MQNGGHRLTPQRMTVLTILAESDEHPSAEQICERVCTDELGLKTGFRILSHRLDFYGVCPECREQE